MVDSVDQERLFRLATDAVAINAHHTGPSGWCVNVRSRRAGETWARGDQRQYVCLSTDELFDVLVEELARRLGL